MCCAPNFKLEACNLKIDQFCYLIATQIAVLERCNPNPFKSIIMWNQNLKEQGWNTFLPVSEDSSDFIFAFQSEWQQEQLIAHGQGMLMVNSTHNSVDNSCLSDGRKFSLYTFVIRDPVVGKGLPVCWAFTASAAT